MFFGVTLGSAAPSQPAARATRRTVFSAASTIAGGRFDLALTALSGPEVGAPALTALDIDGVSVLDQVAEAASPERAARPRPGTVSGSGRIVSALTEPLEIGGTYLVSYELSEASGLTSLFFPAQNGSPFGQMSLPRTVGRHHLLVTARDGDTTALMRLSGTATFASLSCRRVDWSLPLPAAARSGGQRIDWEIEVGGTRRAGATYTPEPGIFYVSPSGSDSTGSGAARAPFRQPAAAAALAGPGDTVYLRPGSYDPFTVVNSGTDGNPVTFTTLPGEERQAVIRGDLQRHAFYGGPGVAYDRNWRCGIRIEARDHVHIRNLSVEDFSYEGIYVLGGARDTQHGHHVIAGCRTRRTGNAGIFVVGYPPNGVLPLEPPRTIDILIEENDVSETNVITDYNGDAATNPQGEPGGVNEAITVAGGVQGVITRNNDIHDSRQYGIDYKHGVYDGEITGNRVWNMDRYGIYLDTNRRQVHRVRVHGNMVWNCNLGIVLSREADYDPVADADGTDMLQSFRDIDIYNNLIFDIRRTGIFCQRHGGDSPHGEITNVRIRHNTVFNCATSGEGTEARLVRWTDADFAAAGILDGFEFVGNILWRDPAGGRARLIDQFGGTPGAEVRDNLVDVDPRFVDPISRPPDLSLSAGSAALGLVAAAEIVPPFDRDFDGADRRDRRAAGAY